MSLLIVILENVINQGNFKMKKASTEMISFLRDIILVAIVLVLVFLPISSKLLSVFFSNPCPDVDIRVSSISESIQDYANMNYFDDVIKVSFPVLNSKYSLWQKITNQELNFDIFFSVKKEKYSLCYQCSIDKENKFNKCYSLNNVNISKEGVLCTENCPLMTNKADNVIRFINLDFIKDKKVMNIIINENE